jgi:hypothetical protein
LLAVIRGCTRSVDQKPPHRKFNLKYVGRWSLMSLQPVWFANCRDSTWVNAIYRGPSGFAYRCRIVHSLGLRVNGPAMKRLIASAASVIALLAMQAAASAQTRSNIPPPPPIGKSASAKARKPIPPPPPPKSRRVTTRLSATTMSGLDRVPGRDDSGRRDQAAHSVGFYPVTRGTDVANPRAQDPASRRRGR